MADPPKLHDPSSFPLRIVETKTAEWSPGLPPAAATTPGPMFVAADPGDTADADWTLAAPSPDSIPAPRQHGIGTQDRRQVSEVLLREQHAAQMAHLSDALNSAKQAHLAEIERLRAQHAAEVQRLVEALWQAQDAARAALAPSETAAKQPAPAPEPHCHLQPAAAGARPVQFRGWDVRSPLRLPATSRWRIGRRWAAFFTAWS